MHTEKIIQRFRNMHVTDQRDGWTLWEADIDYTDHTTTHGWAIEKWNDDPNAPWMPLKWSSTPLTIEGDK